MAATPGSRSRPATWLAFLDDDAVAAPNWIAALVARDADPRVIGVGGRVLPNWRTERPRRFASECRASAQMVAGAMALPATARRSARHQDQIPFRGLPGRPVILEFRTHLSFRRPPLRATQNSSDDGLDGRIRTKCLTSPRRRSGGCATMSAMTCSRRSAGGGGAVGGASRTTFAGGSCGPNARSAPMSVSARPVCTRGFLRARCSSARRSSLPAVDVARISGALLYPSTPLPEWPIVVAASDTADEAARQRLQQIALTHIANVGHYFGCRTTRDLDALVDSLRDVTGPIRVRRVHASDCFLVVSGHTAAAGAALRGEQTIDVIVERTRTWTPLQEMLRAMSWLEGHVALYQPIDAAEVVNESWPLVRQCTDRFALMHEFLVERKLLPPVVRTFMDVGASYGWFVAQMQRLGFDASGMDVDPLARELAAGVFGIRAERYIVGDSARNCCAARRPMSSPASALLTTSRLDAGRSQSTNSGTASQRRPVASCFSTPAKRTKRGSAGTFRNGHRSTSRSGSKRLGSTKSSRSASTAMTMLRTKATTGARCSPACVTTRTRPRRTGSAGFQWTSRPAGSRALSRLRSADAKAQSSRTGEPWKLPPIRAWRCAGRTAVYKAVHAVARRLRGAQPRPAPANIVKSSMESPTANTTRPRSCAASARSPVPLSTPTGTKSVWPSPCHNPQQPVYRRTDLAGRVLGDWTAPGSRPDDVAMSLIFLNVTMSGERVP